MEKIPVTREQATEALRAVVAERGRDYVYPRQAAPGVSCRYVHRDGENDVPGCLIGAALHRLGVPLSELKAHECWGAWSVVERLTTLDVHTGMAMFDAQNAQDGGSTWGECLDLYLRRISETTDGQ